MARILVIDDDPAILQFIKLVLERDKHEVFTTDDGQSGLDLLQENEIDLVITDLVMPEMAGLTVIREIRKSFPQVRIIAITAGIFDHSTNSLQSAHEAGCHITLRKPVLSADILKAVKEVLDKSRGYFSQLGGEHK